MVLFPLLRRLFKGIHVPVGQAKMIQDVAKVVPTSFHHVVICMCHSVLLFALQKGYPLVFLPTHKSHMDYLLMSFILVNIDVKVR